MKYTRLSEVDLVNEMSEDTNVLIEKDGEIKRVPKSEVGAQADWNEKNEASPAFILNKPTSLGGYAYYAAYGSYIVKCEEPVFPSNGISSSTVTASEFVEDFKSGPVMLLLGHDGLNEWNGLKPVVNCWYNAYYANKLNVVFFDGYSPYKEEFSFVEE